MSTFVRGPIEGGDCANCPFATEGAPTKPVAGIGPEVPEWLVIGEGPGTQEVRYGMPFVGPSGQLLDKVLADIGVDRKKLHVTNVTLCKPPDGGKEEDRDEAAKHCRPRLEAELRTMPGKPALLLGAVATRALVESPLVKISDLAGTYHEVDVDGSGARVLVPTLHPAFLLRSQGQGGKGDSRGAGGGHTAAMGYVNIKFDASKVKAVAQGRQIKCDVVGDIEIADVKRANQLVQDIVREVYATKFCALDLETFVDNPDRNHALQMFVAKIRLFGISTLDRGVTVLWSLLTPATINSIRAVLASKEITKGYHNMIYEHGVFQNQFYRFRIDGPQEDSMLGHHAAFPGNRHVLQSVACQFRGWSAWKSEFRDEAKRLKDEEALTSEAVYNLNDHFATAKTFEPLHFWIKKTKTENVYEVDRQMAALAARMHIDGYHVDRDVNAELVRQLSTAVDASHESITTSFEEMREKVISRLAFERAKTKRKADPEDFTERMAIRQKEEEKLIAKGKWDFSPGKDMHMIALLKARGVPLTKVTETGRTSTAAGVLEDLAYIPEVAALLRYRSNEKLLTTFVKPMFEWMLGSDKKTWRPPYVQDDGRCHTIWSVNKLSGRWGSEDPMFQNVSRGDEKNKDVSRRLPNLRRQYVAPPRKRLIAFDFEQLEARTMAVQSDDPFLCKVFAEKRDIHSEFAVLVFPNYAELPKDSEERGQKRDVTKRLEYGGVYGGADDTVWKSIVVDFPEITLAMTSAAIKKIKLAVAGVLRWQQQLFIQCSKPPYELRSYVLGRRRVFPMGDPSPTDVNNNPNQFMGADIMNIGLSRFIQQAGGVLFPKYRGRVIMISQVHDAAYFECDDDDRLCTQVARDVKSSFEQVYTSPSGVEIDFPIELKQGYAMNDYQKDLVWEGCGREGLKKLKLAA